MTEHIEWACRWLPEADGHVPLTPACDEEWARKHARQWGTIPVRRTCGPWTESDALEAAPRPLVEIAAERVRQDAKFGEQRDYADGTGGDGATEVADLLRAVCKAAPADGDKWSDILVEEVAEALAEAERAALRRELIQVAAVAVAWVEALDRRLDPS